MLFYNTVKQRVKQRVKQWVLFYTTVFYTRVKLCKNLERRQ